MDDERPDRSGRWQHLVHGAFLLDARALGDGPPGKQAERFLESVLEVFGPELDPVEDLEGYSVRRMALSLLSALRGT